MRSLALARLPVAPARIRAAAASSRAPAVLSALLRPPRSLDSVFSICLIAALALPPVVLAVAMQGAT